MYKDSVRPFYFENPEFKEDCEYSYGGSGVVTYGNNGETLFVTAKHNIKSRTDYDNIRIPINNESATTWDVVEMFSPLGGPKESEILRHYISDLLILRIENSEDFKVPAIARLCRAKDLQSGVGGIFKAVGFPRDGVFESIDYDNKKIKPRRLLLDGNIIVGDRAEYDGTMMMNGISNWLTTPNGKCFRIEIPKDIQGMCGGGVFDHLSSQLIGIICAASNDGLRFIDWNIIGLAFAKVKT